MRKQNQNHKLIEQLDSHDQNQRLNALQSLCDLQRRGSLDMSAKAGPVLPSYIHVHTTVSYGCTVPGVHSAARMVWAANESHADSILIVEHESVAHFAEAEQAVDVVNRGRPKPLRLILGVEFKAPIDVEDDRCRSFSRKIGRQWGQGEAAWVVAMAARPNDELTKLTGLFQKAKRRRAQQQLEKLNHHLAIDPPVRLSQMLTPEGNVTDRTLCHNVAAQAKNCGNIRAMLNPGGPAHVSYPAGLPSYQELVAKIAALGITPTFTTQLRGQPLADVLPLLKSWGITALDLAGVEPDDPNAENDIRQIIQLAEQNELFLIGGSDYRGSGTGWTKHAPWMDCLLIRKTIGQL